MTSKTPEIRDLAAKYVRPEEIAERLGLAVKDVQHHLDLASTQKAIKELREALVQSLPIQNRNFRLLKYDEIVMGEATVAEKLSALRAARQEMEGDDGDDDWLRHEVNG